VILGGSGFIGRHVALALLGRGETVVIADRSPLREMPPAEASRLSFVETPLPLPILKIG
jgi:nucleoside-diphosphate-sugar epimerase